ncbi:MAG: glycosyltransferase family 4 protein [Paludibacter sp.]
MKISYVTPYNALDIHNWSGSGFYIAKALENQNNQIDYVGNLEMKSTKIMSYKRRGYRKFNLKFDEYREISVAKHYALEAVRRIDPMSDIIFSPGSVPIAFLNSNKPKVIYTDACFAGIYGFYDEYSNYCKESIRKANKIEQKALDNCDLAIYALDWAAQSVIDNYKVNPNKIKVVPFGANIDNYATNNADLLATKDLSQLHMLFIGVDWARKGGDVVLKVVEALNNKGVNTTLHVVGIPNLTVTSKYIQNYGFISKSTSEGKILMESLFKMCHFLFVPSIAEAYGLVFCEANAYGLPALSTNVGGICTIIKNNLNGMTFPLSYPVDKWSDYIYETFTNKQKYKQLCIDSLKQFEMRLNWNIAGKEVTSILKTLL